MKSLKRILSYVMIIIMGVFLFSGVNFKNASAYWRSEYKTDKGTLVYEITDDNEVSIVDYSGEDTELVIPSEIDGKSVTSIGFIAFEGCSNLTNITIPNSVTSIGFNSFENCSSLTSITIPNSVISIGGEAFENCSSLASITIPNSVTSIGCYAFKNCSSLTSITIPNSVTSIESEVFENCSSLTSITIPNSVISIGKSAFENCSSLTSITIPNSVTSIESEVFENCSSLTSITISNSVTSIKGYTFKNCSSLTSITIPNSVTSIESNAFENCSSLISVTIPNSITSIGGGTSETSNKIESGAFNGCSNLTNIIIPESVTNIGYNAFSGCSSLASITIPSSVTNIEVSAFAECKKLTDINVDKENKYFSSENGVLFNKNKSELVCYPDGKKEKKYIIPSTVTSIRGSAFENCSNLTDVTIPESVISIGWSAFENCSNLTGVTIPKSVTSIAPGTFEGCSSLINIIIPNSVKSIEAYPFEGSMNGAFEGCISLTSITIPSSVTSIDLSAFAGCDNLESINVDSDNKCFSSEDGVLFNKDKSKLVYYPYGKKDKKYVIPNKVTNIGWSAFGGCSNLTNITILNSVTSIEGYAFAGCSNLTSITIPNSVTSIGDSAFRNCGSLTSITIPNSVTSIGWNVFRNCNSLTSITIPESVTSIGQYAFAGCSSLTNIIIPNLVTDIGAYAFSGCNSLTSITIPSSVTNIEWNAFENSSNLTSITIPNSVTSIGEDAFRNCNNLTIYGYKNSYAETYANENSIPFKELTSQNLNIESFTTDKVSPQISGTKITLTAKATGGDGTLQYKFLIKDNATGNWSILKDYGTSNTYIWTTKAIGNKTLYVDVKDENGTVVRKSMSYTVKEEAKAPVVSSFTANKQSPQISGTKVKLTAKANGSGTLQYKFIIKDNKKGNWYKLRDYGTSNTYTWTTGAIGNKILYVDVKDSNGKVTRAQMLYKVNEVAKAPVVSNFIVDKQSPQISGTKVKLTAKATGSGTLQYKFIIKDNKTGNWYKLRDYETTNTYTWTTGTKGEKTLYVDVKDSNGKVTRKSMNYVIK